MSRGNVVSSDEEMASAVSILKAQGKRVNNVALNRLMGRGRRLESVRVVWLDGEIVLDQEAFGV